MKRDETEGRESRDWLIISKSNSHLNSACLCVIYCGLSLGFCSAHSETPFPSSYYGGFWFPLNHHSTYCSNQGHVCTCVYCNAISVQQKQWVQQKMRWDTRCSLNIFCWAKCYLWDLWWFGLLSPTGGTHTDVLGFFFFLYLIRRQTDPFMGPPAVCAYAVCSWMLTIGAISSCHSLCTIVPTLCVGVHCAARHTHTLCQCSHYPLLCWSCFISPPLLCLLCVFPWQFFLLPYYPTHFPFTHSLRLRAGWVLNMPPPSDISLYDSVTWSNLDPRLMRGNLRITSRTSGVKFFALKC